MAKMIAGGLTEKVVLEQTKQFYFFEPDNIPPPVIMVQHVSFRYNSNSVSLLKILIYEKISSLGFTKILILGLIWTPELLWLDQTELESRHF